MWITVHDQKSNNPVLINLDNVFYILGGSDHSFICFGTQDTLIPAKESMTEIAKMISAKSANVHFQGGR